MLTKLSVNLNKIALIRNSREGNTPSVTLFAALALKAGAAGITVHPRPDQRHIRADDVPALARLIARWPGREFNIEGNPFMNLMEHAESARPHQLTFVPDDAAQKTSDHGFDLEKSAKDLLPLIRRGHELGARVSIFMDPVPEQMALAKEIGADRVELYTEAYAAGYEADREKAIAPYVAAAEEARRLGLGLNAGHDLNLQNLSYFLRTIPFVDEVSIGHALISDALYFGLENTVTMYLREIPR